MTMSSEPTLTGSPWMPRAARAATGPRRRCGSPARLGPYNFEFMTEVQQRDHDPVPGRRHLHQPLGGIGHVLLRALPQQFPGGHGPGTAAHRRPAGSAHGAPTSSGDSSGSSSSGGSGMPRSARSIPDACVIPNTGRRRASALDMRRIGELAPTLFADRQARSGLMPPWANGKNAKEYRATMGSKPVGGIFSVGVEEAYRWKDCGAERRGDPPVGADGIANGLRPWFTKFCGTLHDQRWLKPVEELYGWRHAQSRRYLRNETPLARVGHGLLPADRAGSTAATGRGRRWRTTRWAGTRR